LAPSTCLPAPPCAAPKMAPASPQRSPKRLSASKAPAESKVTALRSAALSKLKASWELAVYMLPQLAVAFSFAGSALLMKVLPLAGLAPATMQEELLSAYEGFVALPLLKPVLAPLGVGARELMLGLALAHLFAAALLVLPKGPVPARCAGLWAMVAMAGAEYCTRSTGFVPPMTPPQFKWHASVIGTFCHLFLFCCGAACLFREKTFSLGALSFAYSLFASKSGKSNNKEKVASPAKAKPTSTSTPAGSRKRDSTPPPTKDGRKSK